MRIEVHLRLNLVVDTEVVDGSELVDPKLGLDDRTYVVDLWSMAKEDMLGAVGCLRIWFLAFCTFVIYDALPVSGVHRVLSSVTLEKPTSVLREVVLL